MTSAVYVIARGQQRIAHVHLAVARLRRVVDTLIVVVETGQEAAVGAALEASPPDRIVPAPGPLGVVGGYQAGLAALRAGGLPDGPLILTAANVFGPIGDLGARLAAAAGDAADLLAPYWQDTALDIRLTGRSDLPARIPHLDFAILSPRLLADPGFWAVWERFRPTGDPWAEFLAGPAALAAWMEAGGHTIGYAVPEDLTGSADPRLYEIDKLVAHGAPCLAVAALSLDPLLHDLNAIDLKAALDTLRGRDPEVYAAVIAFAGRELKLRDFTAAADQYEVLSETADPIKRDWAFGPVAVFIHAFYAEMMPEFCELTERLPCRYHLFVTTASDENKAEIETFLREKGLGGDAFTVRVVEQNRGRDMSSLFITWRDVVLEGRYEVALRLHSKRTPQVARQVGESFKTHLFDNLVASPGYVANLLDRLEAEPDIGLVIAPVIHVGFSTLGHSWFTNKPVVARLMKEMDLEVPLDDYTPVAPYGTMYWFRTAALAPMFERRWNWKEYNAEPRHVDGGLAHVQERMIGYVVQSQNFRVLTVMTPRLAGRYYAKLEYKMQLIAAHLTSGNVLDQVAQVESATGRVRSALFRRLLHWYAGVLARHPGMRGPLRPFKAVAVAMLTGRRQI